MVKLNGREALGRQHKDEQGEGKEKSDVVKRQGTETNRARVRRRGVEKKRVKRMRKNKLDNDRASKQV